ncbi:MAG: hypothetical protein DMG32_21415 [Acidobacteria bacterium]|nr:MAG: hypothetical protein DMG32_21415 [Acidobacteriota bacterium]
MCRGFECRTLILIRVINDLRQNVYPRRWFGHNMEDWFRAESELLHPVHLEMAESDDSIIVRAEVPGFNTKELEINVEPRKLTITGKHQAQEERKKPKTIYSERCAKEILQLNDILPINSTLLKLQSTTAFILCVRTACR